MKEKKALGIIETYGLISAIEAADTAVKAANVELIGYELARGGGLTTVKVLGDVGGVKAAMSAANASASKVGKVVSTHVIPRPHDEIEIFMKPEVALADERQMPEDKGNKPAETSKKDEVQEIQPPAEHDGTVEQKYTCNMCKDPKCPRKKGDPRANCIHYGEGDI